MESFLLSGLAGAGAWKYLLLFFGMFVEGDVVLFAGGFLMEQGYFHLALGFFVMFAGTILGDVMWYWFGIKFKDSPFFLFRIVRKLSVPFDIHLRKYPLHTLTASKFSIGIHRAIVFRVGTIQIPFWQFFKTNLIASALWVVGIGAVGYLSGAYFELIKVYVRYAEIGLLAALLAFVLLTHFVFKKTEKAAALAEQKQPISG